MCFPGLFPGLLGIPPVTIQLDRIEYSKVEEVKEYRPLKKYCPSMSVQIKREFERHGVTRSYCLGYSSSNFFFSINHIAFSARLWHFPVTFSS